MFYREPFCRTASSVCCALLDTSHELAGVLLARCAVVTSHTRGYFGCLGNYTVKKKGPRGVRFEGCYSPRSVMATHKGVELTSWGVGRLR